MASLVRETPLVWCALGCWLKLESLQRTGSFKLRGATAALRALAGTGVMSSQPLPGTTVSGWHARAPRWACT